MTNLHTRRAFAEVMSAAAIGIGGVFATSRANAVTPGVHMNLSVPDQVKAFMKAQNSLSEGKTIWRTRGIIMAALPNQTPFPILRFMGCEQKWHRPLGGNRYVTYSSLINFLCDYETNQILNDFRNPITGKLNKVRHYVSRIPEGAEISEEGVFLNIVRKAYPDFYAGSRFDMDIEVIEDTISFRGEVKWPPELREPPSSSVQSFFARFSEVMNPELSWVPSHFAGHVLMKWYPWMEMDQQPGHMLWHATGYKIRSHDSLPREYMERVTRDYADIFDKSPELDVGPSGMAKRLQQIGRLPKP